MAKLKCVIEEMVEEAAPRKRQRLAGGEGGGSAGGGGSACTNTDASATGLAAGRDGNGGDDSRSATPRLCNASFVALSVAHSRAAGFFSSSIP